ncbi:hypothetical protein BH11PAT2_BH11PAT2_03540 [soil metagenome]
MTDVNQVIQAHSWVKTANRDFWPRGFKPLGESSTVVDTVHVPYLETTFILAFESSWATIGGIQKKAVLYAYNHRTSSRKVVSTHTIFDGKNAMSAFYPTKIAVIVRFETKEFRYDSANCPCRKKSFVVTNVCMVGERQFNGYAIEGVYTIIKRRPLSLAGYGGYDDVIIASRIWTTGNVDASVLTKRNISRFYRKYKECTLETPEIGAG